MFLTVGVSTMSMYQHDGCQYLIQILNMWLDAYAVERSGFEVLPHEELGLTEDAKNILDFEARGAFRNDNIVIGSIEDLFSVTLCTPFGNRNTSHSDDGFCSHLGTDNLRRFFKLINSCGDDQIPSRALRPRLFRMTGKGDNKLSLFTSSGNFDRVPIEQEGYDLKREPADWGELALWDNDSKAARYFTVSQVLNVFDADLTLKDSRSFYRQSPLYVFLGQFIHEMTPGDWRLIGVDYNLSLTDNLYDYLEQEILHLFRAEIEHSERALRKAQGGMPEGEYQPLIYDVIRGFVIPNTKYEVLARLLKELGNPNETVRKSQFFNTYNINLPFQGRLKVFDKDITCPSRYDEFVLKQVQFHPWYLDEQGEDGLDLQTLKGLLGMK